MCGIAAILLYPQERSAEHWAAIKEVFTRNLVSNEERGMAATGFAIVQADGGVALQKMPLAASEFVTTVEYRDLLARIDSQTTLLLGHTRLPTKGSPFLDGNNHPLDVGPVLGVHNGQVENDDALFDRYGYPRQAQVDSEIIFHLIAAVPPPREDAAYLKAVSQRLGMLRGEFTFLACDRRAPGKLLVFRQDNPLWIHYQADWNALLFSSRYVFLRRTFGRTLAAEMLPRHQVVLFHANRLPHLECVPVAALPLPEMAVSEPAS